MHLASVHDALGLLERMKNFIKCSFASIEELTFSSLGKCFKWLMFKLYIILALLGKQSSPLPLSSPVSLLSPLSLLYPALSLPPLLLPLSLLSLLPPLFSSTLSNVCSRE